MDTVFFDLDGTLADTAPDHALALNQLRAEQGFKPLPFYGYIHDDAVPEEWGADSIINDITDLLNWFVGIPL